MLIFQVLGEIEEFDRAVKLVISQVNFSGDGH
jgi:hypothetical protein